MPYRLRKDDDILFRKRGYPAVKKIAGEQRMEKPVGLGSHKMTV